MIVGPPRGSQSYNRSVEHPNAELATQAWEAIANSDIDALNELWAPDIVWHATSDNPWFGDHVGIDAILDYLAAVGEAGETYDTRLIDVLVSNDRVLLVTGLTARRFGKQVETSQCMLARIENAKIAEVWTLALDPEVFVGFWENPPAVEQVG